MKKNYAVLFLAATLLVAAGGCSKEEAQEPEVKILSEQEEKRSGDKSKEENSFNETNQEEEAIDFSFADLKHQQFIFCSGAGGWQTVLDIEEDGSFIGDYQDSDMGTNGQDNPNGTVYKCAFSGQFTEPVKVSDYTYSVRIAELTYEKEAGTEEYADGFRYVYSDAYGLEGAEEILIYRPGAPLAELPEAYLGWAGYYDLEKTEETELPFWGLYNAAQENGFYSYDMIENAKETLANTEEWAADIENALENEALTQTDMNLYAQDLYNQWDYMLNHAWGVLKETLDEEAFAQLTVEEREWIAEKEVAVAEAGAEVEGGSMYGLVVNLKAAELTKERVYELMELLD